MITIIANYFLSVIISYISIKTWTIFSICHNFVNAATTTTNFKMQDNKYTIAVIAFIGFLTVEALPINETICKGIPPNVIVLLPHPENCSLFIECANEVPVEFSCPDGLHWNTQARQCDFPEIANCKINNTNILTPINNQKWTKTKTCEGVLETENVLLPNPNDCETFIQCVDQKPVVHQCPLGLQWNAARNMCDWPESAKCNDTKTKTVVGTNKWTNCNGVPENIDVLLPNPENCGSYIQCVHQKPMVRPCPSGLHWNAAKNVCDWPQFANCKRNSCEGVPETENVLLPNPEDCGTFIQCVHQKPVVQSCPVGLHWNTSINRCDWPHIAKCNVNVNP